jgi:alpha-ribazole phosphatase
VRHPRPLGSDGLCYGRADLDVDRRELDQAVWHLDQVLPAEIDQIVSSPLSRCRLVAAGLAAARDRPAPLPTAPWICPATSPITTHPLADRLTVELDERLTELDFGDWESRRWDDIDAGDLNAWSQAYDRQPPPGGESWNQMRERVSDFLDQCRRRDSATVVAVTHSGVIRATLAQILDLTLTAMWRIDLPFEVMAEVRLADQGDQLLGLRAR